MTMGQPTIVKTSEKREPLMARSRGLLADRSGHVLTLFFRFGVWGLGFRVEGGRQTDMQRGLE